MGMICFAFIGLFFFDGYLGFSYLSSLVVNGVMPNELYEEAFWPIHRRWKLPLVSSNIGGSGGGGGGGSANSGGSNSLFYWFMRLLPLGGNSGGGGSNNNGDNNKDERIGLRLNNSGGSVVGTDLELVEEMRSR